MATPQAGRGAAAPGERCRMKAAGPSGSRRIEERHPFKPEPGVAADQTTRSWQSAQPVAARTVRTASCPARQVWLTDVVEFLALAGERQLGQK